MPANRTGLVAGIAAAALFVAVSTVEALTRPAFDLSRHAISMLSLGERGWTMVATFLVTGALVVAMALALRRLQPGRAASLLIGGFGVGLVIAGFFPAPRGQGFPAGTPLDLEPEMTPAAILHSVGFNLAFGCLIAACFVLAVRYRRLGRPGAANGCLVAGVGIPVLIVLGFTAVVPTGVAFYLAAVAAWAWLATIAALHLRDARVAHA
jgi:hypothetical protein